MVISAVLQGFRAIESGTSPTQSDLATHYVEKLVLVLGCQPRNYRQVRGWSPSGRKVNVSPFSREDLVGEALQTLYNDHGFKRRDLFLQSKSVTLAWQLFWHLTCSPIRYVQFNSQDSTLPLPYNPSDPLRVQVTASFYASLSFLRTGYLDAFILHQKLPTYSQTLEAWKALVKLQDLGKVRAIGMRNVYRVGLLERLGKESGRPVQIVQDRWRSRNNWDSNILDWCRKNGAQFQ